MDNEVLQILKEMHQDMKDMKQDINSLKQDVNGLKQDVELIKIQQKEHASEEHKSHIDNLAISLAKIEGEVKSLRKDLSAVELITSKNWNDIVMLKAVK